MPRGVKEIGTGHQSELSWVMGHLPQPKGVELHVLCPVLGLSSSQEVFNAMGATWHLVALKKYEPLFLRRRFWWSARKIVQRIKPDVIHGWGGETGWGLLATYFSQMAVVSVQGLLRMWGGNLLGCRDGVVGTVREGFQRLLEIKSYRRAGFCLCESETSKSVLKHLYGVDGIVVPQPLRREFVQSELERKVGGRGKVKFLFVGQDVFRKGIDDLREVERRNPQLQIRYVTGGKNAAEVAGLMQASDVFVLPSYGDTGPTAIKEALAMGLSVIAYDNTGPKELLEKYGGTLVKTGDVDALAREMLRLSERCQDFEARSTAAMRVRHDLSREAAWGRLLEVYDRVRV